MVPAIMPKGRKLDLAAAASLVRPRDSPLCGFVAGQPVGFLEALGARSDLEDIVLYTGLLQRPYALVQNPGVRVVSGFFGPVERMARAAGPSSRRRATRSGSRSPRWMPRIEGILELGGNRVHVSEVDAWVAPGGTTVAGGPRDRESRVRTHPARIDPVVRQRCCRGTRRAELPLPQVDRQGGRYTSVDHRAGLRGGDTRVTTPRHHVQYVVTEYAAPEGDASPRRRLVVREIAPNQQFTRSPFPPEHNGCPSPILT